MAHPQKSDFVFRRKDESI